MKILVPALLLSAVAAASPQPTVSARALPRAVEAVQDDAAFRTAFEQAIGIGAKDEMKKLVQQNQDAAVRLIIETAFQAADKPNEKVVKRMNALRESWSAAHETDFAQRIERWFARMPQATKRARKENLDQYNATVTRHANAVAKKDVEALTRIAGEFEVLAGRFGEVGDEYMRSQCLVTVAVCFDEGSLGSSAQLDKVAAALEGALAAREAVGLVDRTHGDSSARLVTLNGMGYGADAKAPAGGGEGAEAGGAPLAPVESGPAVTVKAEFEALDDVYGLKRPNYFIDEHTSIWHAIYLKKKGSTAAIPRLSGPQAIRSGSAEASIDTDGDGEGDVELPFRGKEILIEFEYGDPATPRKAAFWAKVGQEQELYQGIESNAAPQDGNVQVFVSPASSVVGELAGTPIRVIDENMSGAFGDAPSSWQFQGLTPKQYHPEFDSVVIGKSKRAQPWSEYLQVEDQWYRMQSSSDGLGFTATPIRVATGKVNLKFKGPKPSFVVLVGSDTFASTYIDVANGPVDVPTGKWSLYCGLVTKGKKRQLMKALMLPGPTTETWRVERDAKLTIEMGGPFDLDFDVQVEGDLVTVPGTTVCVVGKAGERYERLWDCVPKPSMSYRKAGAKRGSKPEKMGAVASTEELYKDYNQAWFPKSHSVKKKPGEDEVEVQLVEKKNRLFGKIESTWRS